MLTLPFLLRLLLLLASSTLIRATSQSTISSTPTHDLITRINTALIKTGYNNTNNSLEIPAWEEIYQKTYTSKPTISTNPDAATYIEKQEAVAVLHKMRERMNWQSPETSNGTYTTPSPAYMKFLAEAVRKISLQHPDRFPQPPLSELNPDAPDIFPKLQARLGLLTHVNSLILPGGEPSGVFWAVVEELTRTDNLTLDPAVSFLFIARAGLNAIVRHQSPYTMTSACLRRIYGTVCNLERHLRSLDVELGIRNELIGLQTKYNISLGDPESEIKMWTNLQTRFVETDDPRAAVTLFVLMRERLYVACRQPESLAFRSYVERMIHGWVTGVRERNDLQDVVFTYTLERKGNLCPILTHKMNMIVMYLLNKEANGQWDGSWIGSPDEIKEQVELEVWKLLHTWFTETQREEVQAKERMIPLLSMISARLQWVFDQTIPMTPACSWKLESLFKHAKQAFEVAQPTKESQC